MLYLFNKGISLWNLQLRMCPSVCPSDSESHFVSFGSVGFRRHVLWAGMLLNLQRSEVQLVTTPIRNLQEGNVFSLSVPLSTGRSLSHGTLGTYPMMQSDRLSSPRYHGIGHPGRTRIQRTGLPPWTLLSLHSHAPVPIGHWPC